MTKIIDLSTNLKEEEQLSFNSVSLKLTDAIDGTATIDMIFDPPIPEDFDGTPMDFKEQACTTLAFYLLNLLNKTGELSIIEDTIQ
jgi:hypothetical protein